MLQLLAARELGLDPPWLLPKVYGSQRFVQLGLTEEKEFVKAHKKGVNSLDVDRDSGRYVLSGGADVNGAVVIHDVQKPPGCGGRVKCPVVTNTSVLAASRTESHSHAVSVVQWYPHDTGIFSTSSVDRVLRIWDTNELCVVEKFKFVDPVYAHSMAAASTHCLTAVGGRECKITLCDMQTGSATHILRSHRKPVLALAWSPRSDHILASGSQDNKVLLWDIRKATGPLLSLDQHNGGGSSNVASVVTAHGGHVNGLCFSSDGLFLASFGTDNQLRLWDTFSGRNTLINYGRIPNTLSQQTCQFTITPHTSTLHPVLCVPSGGDVLLMELFTGKRIRRLQGHYGKVICLLSHPFEQELYSGGSDSNILAWSPPLACSSEPPTTHPMGPGRPHATRMYQDTWSSDED